MGALLDGLLRYVVVGAAELPDVHGAGNVVRPSTTLKLSIRLAPNANAEVAASVLKEVLEEDPPYKANVRPMVT